MANVLFETVLYVPRRWNKDFWHEMIASGHDNGPLSFLGKAGDVVVKSKVESKLRDRYRWRETLVNAYCVPFIGFDWHRILFQ